MRTAIDQGRVAFDGLGELYRPGVRVFASPDGLRSPVGMTVLQSWYEKQNTLFGAQKNFLMELEFLASVGDAIARVAFREDPISAFRSLRPVGDFPYQPLSADLEGILRARGDQYLKVIVVYSTPGGVSEAGWLPNFRGLVLGCMDSYDSEQRRIFLHFSKSTRFASFCTVLISEILPICVNVC